MKKCDDEIYSIDVVEKLIGPRVDPKVEEIYKQWAYNGTMHKSVRKCIYEYLVGARDSIDTHHSIIEYNRIVERLSRSISHELVSESDDPISMEIHGYQFTPIFNWFGHKYYSNKFSNVKSLLYVASYADGKIRNAISKFHLNKREYTDEELSEISRLIYDTRIGLSEYFDKDSFIAMFTTNLRNVIDLDTSVIQKYDLSLENICEIIVDIIHDEKHDTRKLDEIVEFLYDNNAEICKLETAYSNLCVIGNFII